MKTLSKTLTFFICIFLFASSCDLLYEEEEEEESKDVIVTVSLIAEANYASTVEDAAGEPVNIKIFKEGVTITKKLITDNYGAAYYITGSYRMHEGEVFTASAYLSNHPDVYQTMTLEYSDAYSSAETYEDGSPRTFTWEPILILTIRS